VQRQRARTRGVGAVAVCVQCRRPRHCGRLGLEVLGLVCPGDREGPAVRRLARKGMECRCVGAAARSRWGFVWGRGRVVQNMHANLWWLRVGTCMQVRQ
jgi:hypothetical protein